MACFRVGQVWVAARSDAACVRSRAGLDRMESEAGAAGGGGQKEEVKVSHQHGNRSARASGKESKIDVPAE